MKYASFILLPCLILPAVAAERHGQGPLYVRSQNPGQSFRLTSLPHDARGLPAGHHVIGLHDAVSNIWGESDSENYLLDFHMNDAGLFYAGGLSDRVTLGFGVTERRILDLHLDQPVLQFHELAGIDQDGRREVPRNDLRIRIDRYGLDLRKENLDGQLISQSLETFVTWQWLDGGNTSLSAGSFLHVRHELSDEALVTEDSTDGALGLSATWPVGNDLLYANISYTRLGKTERSIVPIKQDLFSGVLSWEHPLSPDNSFYIQYMVDSQIFADDLGDLSQPANQLQFGWKLRRQQWVWQVALVENFIRFSNSPDVSLSLGLHYALTQP
jgi:hypothetical protein